MLGLSVIILFKSLLHVFCSLVFSAHNSSENLYDAKIENGRCRSPSHTSWKRTVWLSWSTGPTTSPPMVLGCLGDLRVMAMIMRPQLTWSPSEKVYVQGSVSLQLPPPAGNGTTWVGSSCVNIGSRILDSSKVSEGPCILDTSCANKDTSTAAEPIKVDAVPIKIPAVPIKSFSSWRADDIRPRAFLKLSCK